MTDVLSTAIDNLVFAAYRFNRQNSPHVDPERWVRVFVGYDVPALEERYQHERAASDGPYLLRPRAPLAMRPQAD